MGLAQRADTSPLGSNTTPATDQTDEPFASVADWFDEEESGPWCVDDGAAIRVMPTRDVYQAVEEGRLTPDTKVWRDGRACWLAIAECYELTVKPPAEDTPVSAVRRIQRAEPAPPPPVRADEPHKLVTLTTSFALGVLIGALLYLPFAL